MNAVFRVESGATLKFLRHRGAFSLDGGVRSRMLELSLGGMKAVSSRRESLLVEEEEMEGFLTAACVTAKLLISS